MPERLVSGVVSSSHGGGKLVELLCVFSVRKHDSEWRLVGPTCDFSSALDEILDMFIGCSKGAEWQELRQHQSGSVANQY